MIVVQFCSFARGYTVLPTPFSEERICSHLTSCQILIDHIYMGLFTWAPDSVSVVYVSVFISVAHCFDYYSLGI